MPPPPDERPAPQVGRSQEPPAAPGSSGTVAGDSVTPVDSSPAESAPSWDATSTAALPADARGAGIFSRGDLVAARYRIVRFIARGGMGEVYEAEDLELGVHVALKTVRPDAEGQSQATERFKREIQ